MQIHFNEFFFFLKILRIFFHDTGIFLYTKMPDEKFFGYFLLYSIEYITNITNIQTFSELIITENNTE